MRELQDRPPRVLAALDNDARPLPRLSPHATQAMKLSKVSPAGPRVRSSGEGKKKHTLRFNFGSSSTASRSGRRKRKTKPKQRLNVPQALTMKGVHIPRFATRGGSAQSRALRQPLAAREDSRRMRRMYVLSQEEARRRGVQVYEEKAFNRALLGGIASGAAKQVRWQQTRRAQCRHDALTLWWHSNVAEVALERLRALRARMADQGYVPESAAADTTATATAVAQASTAALNTSEAYASSTQGKIYLREPDLCSACSVAVGGVGVSRIVHGAVCSSYIQTCPTPDALDPAVLSS